LINQWRTKPDSREVFPARPARKFRHPICREYSSAVDAGSTRTEAGRSSSTTSITRRRIDPRTDQGRLPSVVKTEKTQLPSPRREGGGKRDRTRACSWSVSSVRVCVGHCTAIRPPSGVAMSPYTQLTGWSPLFASAGTVRFTWYRPGLTSATDASAGRTCDLLWHRSRLDRRAGCNRHRGPESRAP